MAELDALEPATIEVEGELGGKKPQYHMQKAFNWVVGEEKRQAELLKQVSRLRLNEGERIDWQLQEDVSVLGIAGSTGELRLGDRIGLGRRTARRLARNVVESRKSIADP